MVKNIEKILLPLDFSEASEPLFQYANRFAERVNAKLFILYVAEFPFTFSGLAPELPGENFEENMKQFARETMDQFIDDHVDQIEVSFEKDIVYGHVAEEIIRYARKKEIDLIIIGTHGFTGVDKMIFGSVSDKVLKLGPCPTLVVNTFRE